jgi:hypothetical protein
VCVCVCVCVNEIQASLMAGLGEALLRTPLLRKEEAFSSLDAALFCG